MAGKPSCIGSRIYTPRNALRKGSFAPEFALLSPVIFLLLIGTVEICLIFGGQQLLENAAFNASRLGKTGYVENDLTRTETIMQVLYQELQSYGKFFDVSRVTMESTVFSTWQETGTGGGEAGLGDGGKIVVYKITYPWRIFTPLMCTALGSACHQTSDGAFMNLTARIVVRNEPYGGS
ncbi:MAG: pilus assembly protein [Alphaproteobacteria bacterium]|nr:pilus assembly protein [Alphaproteobacteria bacterium]